jgi:tetratricopeptide (TPR) repeat protein
MPHSAAPVDRFGAVARSAVAAYRTDLASRPQRAGDVPDPWLEVALLVEHAGLVPDPERAELLDRADAVAREHAGDDALRQAATEEWGDASPGPVGSVVLLTDRMQAADMLHLAAVTLDALLAAAPGIDAVARGRVLAKRARVAWKLGQMDQADDRYRAVDRLGRRGGSVELQARAAIGLVALAQLRGNYPEHRRHAVRAVRLAERTGIRSLVRNAHSGMLVAAAVARDLDAALVHGWAVYAASRGDPVAEAEVLQNLGQALLDAGHVVTARAVFASVVARVIPARIMLPALGGLALAAAAANEPDTVQWAARQVAAMHDEALPRYALASAFVECAIAAHKIGDRATAERLRTAGERIATRHGFHEVVYRAAELEQEAQRRLESAAELGRSAAAVARELEWMQPSQLPERIALVAATVP